MCPGWCHWCTTRCGHYFKHWHFRACNYLPLFTYLFVALPGPDRDFVVLSGSTLEFTDVGTTSSNSSNSVVLTIIDDDIAEPCESFICTLQGGAVDRVRGVEPNRVTVRICDNDGEHKRVCAVHIVWNTVQCMTSLSLTFIILFP